MMSCLIINIFKREYSFSMSALMEGVEEDPVYKMTD